MPISFALAACPRFYWVYSFCAYRPMRPMTSLLVLYLSIKNTPFGCIMPVMKTIATLHIQSNAYKDKINYILPKNIFIRIYTFDLK